MLIPCHRVIQQSGALGGIAGDQPRSLWYKHGKKCVMNRLRYNNAMQPTLVHRSADGERYP
ncbi:MGMT family protein [Shewanella sp. PP-Sp27a-2]